MQPRYLFLRYAGALPRQHKWYELPVTIVAKRTLALPRLSDLARSSSSAEELITSLGMLLSCGCVWSQRSSSKPSTLGILRSVIRRPGLGIGQPSFIVSKWMASSPSNAVSNLFSTCVALKARRIK